MNGINAGRRRILGTMGAVTAAAVLPGVARAHGIGIVNPPLALPLDVRMVRHDGAQLPLQAVLGGRFTALQLMFTGCSQTCPLQGAIFAEVQSRLRSLPAKDVQLLSVSIDPFDDSKSLSAWRKRFGAGSAWHAAVPVPQQLDTITRALRQRADPKANHATQVYFIDRRGQLIWRSEEFAPAHVVAGILQRIVSA